VSRAALICRFQRSRCGTVNDAGTLTVVVLPAQLPHLAAAARLAAHDRCRPDPMVQSGDADCVDHLGRRWLGGGSTPPSVSYPPGAPRGQHPGWFGRRRLASDLWWATLARARAAGDGMRAVVFLAAHELRTRWRGWAVLVLLVAVAGGAMLAAAAGARRTGSAYPRFLTATKASDVLVAPDEPDMGGYFGALARLPGAGTGCAGCGPGRGGWAPVCGRPGAGPHRRLTRRTGSAVRATQVARLRGWT
jgi:hypothetical protein